MLNIVLCDDHLCHNRILETMVGAMLQKNNWRAKVAYQTTSPQALLVYAQAHMHNNLYLLDLDYEQDMDGLALARAIRQFDATSYIVFISAHGEYMPQCYGVKPSDFLMKPLSAVQLEQCLRGIMWDKALQQAPQALHITVGSQDYFLPQSSIYYFEKQKEYVVAHHQEGALRWRESYLSLWGRLMDARFFRTHKGYIVQRSAIKAFDHSKRTLLLTNGDSIPVSRTQKEGLERWLLAPAEKA